MARHSINDIIKKSLFKYELDIVAYKKYGFSIKLDLKLGSMKKRYSDEEAGMIEVDILDNIISNAIWAITGVNEPSEYKSKVKKSGKVTIKTYEKLGEDYIEVEDTGIGIKREHLEVLFEDCFTTRRSKGHGLYYAMKTAKELSGKINVETEEGKGTRFTIIIPRFNG